MRGPIVRQLRWGDLLYASYNERTNCTQLRGCPYIRVQSPITTEYGGRYFGNAATMNKLLKKWKSYEAPAARTTNKNNNLKPDENDFY